MSIHISKYTIISFLLIVVLFQVFRNTPLYVLDKFLAVGCIVLSVFFISKSFLLSKNFYYTTARKFALLVLFLFFISVVSTSRIYKQSILDGITANLTQLQILILAVYAFYFKKEKLSIKNLEKLFIFFIYVNVVILTLFRNYHFTTTSQFSGQELTFKSDFLPKNFIRFGVVYYYISFLKNQKYKDALMSIFLLLYPNVITDFQRGYFTITVLLLMYSFFLFKKSNKLLNKMVGGLCALFLALVLVLNSSSPVIATIQSKYSNLIQGVTTGQSDEASIKFRLYELKVGYDLFMKSPLTGVGKIKSTNAGKYFSKDFFPTDVGIVGILSTFGIIGLIFFLYLLFLSFKYFRFVLKNSGKHSVFTIALAAYVFYLALESFQTGYIMFYPAYWCFLYLLQRYSINNDAAVLAAAAQPEVADEFFIT